MLWFSLLDHFDLVFLKEDLSCLVVFVCLVDLRVDLFSAEIVLIGVTWLLRLCVAALGFSSMSCFKPIPAYKSEDGTIKFWPASGHSEEFCLPCGRCVGCLLERSRQWAVRLVHESQLWDKSCFVTLTYSDEHLPPYGSLRLRDFQLFMKRLRRSLSPGQRVSFFHCGEYGDENYRPHYHAVIFGWRPDDGVELGSGNGNPIFYSPMLERLWESRGLCSYGNVTFESAAYVARYCLKKRPRGLSVDGCPSNYARVDDETGEIVEVEREYATMSRRPAIADRWFKKFFSDVYPSDEVIVQGRTGRPPRFYDRRLKRRDPLLFEQLKQARIDRGLDFASDNTPERLAVREAVVIGRTNQLKRSV